MDETEIKRQIVQNSRNGDIFRNEGCTYSFIYSVEAEEEPSGKKPGFFSEPFARVVVYVSPLSSNAFVLYEVRTPAIIEQLKFDSWEGLILESREKYDVPDLFVDKVYMGLNWHTPIEVSQRAQVLREILPEILQSINKHEPLDRTEKTLDSLVGALN